MQKVVITDSNLGDGSTEREVLQPYFEVERADLMTEDEVIQRCADADGLLVQWAPITERVLSALPRLRVIVRYGIGLDNIDLAAAEIRDVRVQNVDDYCIDEVADHSLAAIYAHNRRLTVAGRQVADGVWSLDDIPPPLPLSQDPVGIVGFGRIGRAVARRAGALGFPVRVWDPYVSEVPDGVVQHAELVDLAASVNHLTLHVPLTDETHEIVDGTVIQALGPQGHLVNTARGGLVAESDLLEALERGSLGFASLDVTSTEPPTGVAADLSTHRRVLATPHMAYLSTRSLPLLQRRAAELIRDALLGAG